MPSAMDGRPLDRAAMIEAASRNLRQQMGRQRDQPRSRGSFYDAQAAFVANSVGSDARVSRQPTQAGSGSGQNAQRRIRSAENEHRIIQQRDLNQQGPRLLNEGREMLSSTPQPSAALDQYASDDEESPERTEDPQFENRSQFDTPDPTELRRPSSRKKDPSASAAAGLGALSSPAKMDGNAFEQKKTRQPIPVESWGPRPPSRQGGLPAKTSGLDGSLLEEGRSVPLQYSPQYGNPSHQNNSSRARSDAGAGSSNAGGTWAAARSAPMHHPASRHGGGPWRGDRKSKPDAFAEDLGVFGQATRGAPRVGGAPPSNQQLAQALSGVLDHHMPVRAAAVARPDTRESAARPEAYGATTYAFGQSPARPETRESVSRQDVFIQGNARPSSSFGPDASSSFGQGGGGGAGASWASHVDAGPGALEVDNLGEGAAAWPSSPAGSCSGSPPTRQAPRGQVARHSVDQVSVEDVDADADLGLHVNSFRRDATPPRLVVTRSSQQKNRADRGDARRGRGSEPGRNPERGRNMPFSTGLDPDFLGLFAS